MADLNFPASPVDGQTYNNYTYVASKSVWQSIPGLPAGVPAGTIMGWGGSTAPEQWIICDGTAVSRSTYSALYAAIGTTYGVGNGTTTFNLPDLRGKMPVGNHPGIAVTADNTTDVITSATPHGFVDGQKVYFTATTMPTNLTANTNYYVTASTSTTFKVASSLANTSTGIATINFTTNGTGITAFASEFAGLNTSGGTTNHSHRSGSMRAAIGATNNNINYIGYEAGGSQPDGLGPGSTANYTVAGAVQSGTFGFNHYTPVYGNAEDKSSVSPYRVINYIIKYAAAYVPQESELVPRIDALETGGTNYIINGAFDIWQRGTSFSNPVTATFSSDRWRAGFNGSGVTRTVSQQAFPLGSAPAAGYEGEYFYRYAQTVAGTGATFSNVLEQPIEDVRTLSGQTITVSFWAKADATRTVRPIFTQYFGTGGSPSSSTTTNGTLQTLTTSWARYTSTVTLPSMSGKTIGTGNNDCLILTIQSSTINATQTIDIWGVQVEAGAAATPFRRNARSIQGELAACQRYYITGSMGNTYYMGSSNGTGVGTHGFSFAPMRVAPTATVLTFTNSDNASNGGISVFSNSAVNGNFRNASTTFPYYNFTATFKLEAEL